jgi:hypothetical protein
MVRRLAFIWAAAHGAAATTGMITVAAAVAEIIDK